MADITRSVSVMLLGEDVNLDRTLRNASKSFDKFSSNVQDVTGPLADFGKKAAMTEAALIAMTTAGIVYASKKAADFDSQFREITTLLDDTGQSIQQFRGDILDYAQDSTKSIEDINAAIYNAISAGVSYEDALASLSEAEQLAVGTKADLSASVKTLVSTLNAYGEGSEEAARYAEILFETVENGQTTMPELANKIANVTSIAANSGVSFEELAAAIAAVTSTGLPTSETITGLKQTISNIIKPTAQAADMAEQLGIEFDAEALKAEGLSGVLENVKEATGGNTTQMTKLFGSVEALNIAMALTGEGAGKFENILKQTSETTGTLSDAFGKMADYIKNKTQTLVNNVNVALIDFGDRVIESFSGVPDAAADIFAAISEAINAGELDEIFEAIDSFANNFESALKDIAENAPEVLADLEFDGLINSFKNLGESISGAFDALMGEEIDLTTVEGLEKTAQRVLDLFKGLTNFTAGFIEGLDPLFTALGKIAENFADMDEEGQEAAGTLTGLAQSVNTAFQALDSLKAVLIGIAGVAGLNQVAGAIRNIGAAVGAISLGSAVLAAPVGILGLFALIGVLEGKAEEPIGFEFSSNADDVIPGINDLKEAVTDPGGRVERTWDQFFEETKRRAKELFTGDFKAFMDEMADGWEDTVSGFPSVFQENTKTIKDDIYDIETAFLDVEGAVKDTGESTASVFDNEVTPALKKLEDAVMGPTWDFEIEADTDKAVKEIEDLPPKIEKLDPTPWEVPLEIKVKEAEQKIESIKQQGKTARAAFEWSAKVDIAEANADAEKLKAMFESVGESIGSTGDVLMDAFEQISEDPTNIRLRNTIEAEQEARATLLEQQSEAIRIQNEMKKLQLERMEEGEAAMKITVDDSVEPALKLVMMNILELMQTELNSMANQFLIGVDNVSS